MKLWEERLWDSQHDSSGWEKFKTGLGECQVIFLHLGNQNEKKIFTLNKWRLVQVAADYMYSTKEKKKYKST